MQPRILVVDDEEMNLRLLESMLRKHLPGAEVRTAQGGAAALEIVKATPPDIVLLDARMPELDGFEVCRRIKTDPATTSLPVLMVSGVYIDAHHRVSGFEGGADGYITKPFKPQELIAQIQALLSGAGQKEPAFRVMIVDDSRTSRQVITSELKRAPGVQVAAFDSAASARMALGAVKPDLIICDAHLPGTDGFLFCSMVRSEPEYELTPFLLMTETLTAEVRAKARAHGVTELFSKPFPPLQIHDYVLRHMNARRDWFDHDVLLADGDLASRKQLKQYLSEIRLRVHEAGSSAQAFEALERHPIELVLLGERLGDVSGVAWCTQMRSIEGRRWIPVLGLSEDGQPGTLFIKAGADDHVSKKLGREEILLRTRNLLKRVALTNQLDAAVRRERELNEHRNRLLGIAAHDIRSPLTAISHFAESLLASPLEDREAVRERLQTIHGIARQALGMVNGILDASSIRNGTVSLKLEPFRLDELLVERVKLINEVGRRKNIQGSFVNRAPDGGEAVIRADRQRLAQVLDNLLGNVIKYSPEGSTYTVMLDREAEGWLVQVSDNGPGIPRDELFGVFEEFGRTSVQPTGGEKSTGLGLAIAKKLVELHGGTIWMDSVVGGGTTVSFVLPRPPGEAGPDKEPS